MTRNTHHDILDHEEMREAVDVPYDNTSSGATATEVQGAIDEIFTELGGPISAQVYWHEACRVATTAAWSGDFDDLAAGDTLDGETLTAGWRILVKESSAGNNTGIYVVAASGPPTRSTDMPDSALASGHGVVVDDGVENVGSTWISLSTPPSAAFTGASDVEFLRLPDPGGLSPSDVDPELLSGPLGDPGVSDDYSRGDHVHPAVVRRVFDSGSEAANPLVAAISSSAVWDQLAVGLDSSLRPRIDFRPASSSHGVRIRGNGPAASAGDRAEVYMDTIGGDEVRLFVDGPVTSDSGELLGEDDLGVTVAEFDHVHYTTLVLTSDVSSTSTTVVPITDLTSAGLLAGIYLIEAFLPIDTAAGTTGVKLLLAIGGSIVYLSQITRVPLTASTEELFVDFAEGTVTSTGYHGSGVNLTTIVATVSTSDFGTIGLQFGTEVSTSNVTIKEGASMRITRLALA